MDAATLDYGPYSGFLRQFGPPEVLALPDFAGGGFAAERASGFWELVEAVTLTLVTDATVATRLPRLRWYTGDATLFAQAQADLGATASNTVVFTFARDVQPSGAQNSPTIVVPIPVLTILPNWQVQLDVDGGVAGDAITGVQIYRRRFRVIELEPE